MTVGELKALMAGVPDDTPILIPGWGSADGSYVKPHGIQKTRMSPSQMLFSLYSQQPDEAYEFDTQATPDWDAQYGFDSIVLT